MSDKPCQYPRCDEVAVDRRYCRKHRAAANRSEIWQREARTDRSGPEAWSVLALVTIGSACITRTMISRDPVRRREEMQAGCPWTLTFGAIVFAPRPTLEALAYELERDVMRHPRSEFRSQWSGLREGWWPFDAPELEHMAVEVCDRLKHKGISAPVPARELRKLELDLIDPGQARLSRLLDLLAKETGQAR